MRVIIIGNGVAGVTCAMSLRDRNPDAKITIIGGETEFFYSRTALMYAYMDRMTRRDLEPYERKVYAQRHIELVYDWVEDLDATEKSVKTRSGEVLHWDKLVIACGAIPREFPGNQLEGANKAIVNFVSMSDLDECERWTPSSSTAVVAGGGLIGIELVECLVTHGVDTHFIIRESYYWPAALCSAESDYVVAHMESHGVHVHRSTELRSVSSGDDGRVSSVETTSGEPIGCQMLGVCIGVEPNIDWLDSVSTPPDTGEGIMVDRGFSTSLEDVYAIGDCAEFQVPEWDSPLHEHIWYSARRHGAEVVPHLFGKGTPYDPPVFYNSSKFFDIEFTTVGNIHVPSPEEQSIYLKHPSKNQSVRVVHRHGEVVGFNMLGSSWDHTTLMRWVEEGREPHWVLKRLPEAQFDVEFGQAEFSQYVRCSPSGDKEQLEEGHA